MVTVTTYQEALLPSCSPEKGLVSTDIACNHEGSASKFYVYVFLDPRKPGNYQYGEYKFDYEPFYVGKGQKNRVKDHISNYQLKICKNHLKVAKLKKIIKIGFDPLEYVIKLKENLNEENALILEKDLIKLIGRFNLNEGPLSNLTDGGDGFCGYKSKTKGLSYEEIHGKEKADKIKLNLRNTHLGSKNPMFGKGSLLKGRKLTEECKKKMSISKSKAIKQLSLDGVLIKIWKSALEAANYFGVSNRTISNCVSQSSINLTGAGYKWELVGIPNLKYGENKSFSH